MVDAVLVARGVREGASAPELGRAMGQILGRDSSVRRG